MMTKRSFTLLMVLLLGMPAVVASADEAGSIVYLKGKAEIERGAVKQPAKLKAALDETDNVITKARSRAKLLFSDDSILTLGADSKLIVRKYLRSPESKRTESIYELADGKLKAVVGAGGFQVKTPTAFAAARGTVFAVWYDKAANMTWVAVTEGDVEVRSSKDGVEGMQVLHAGQAVGTPGDGPPGQPQTFSLSAGPLAGELSELYETSAPLVLPPLDLIRGADIFFTDRPRAGVTIPPIDQQPVGQNSTRVNMNTVFPSSQVNIRIVFP